jgi:hypothetical protein
MAGFSSGGWRSATNQQENDKDYDPDDKQDPGDVGRRTGQSGQAEQAGDDAD